MTDEDRLYRTDLEYSTREPRVTNQCPECGTLHGETFPLECRNCGRVFGNNEEVLMNSVAAGHISEKQVQEKTGIRIKKISSRRETREGMEGRSGLRR